MLVKSKSIAAFKIVLSSDNKTESNLTATLWTSEYSWQVVASIFSYEYLTQYNELESEATTDDITFRNASIHPPILIDQLSYIENV